MVDQPVPAATVIGIFPDESAAAAAEAALADLHPRRCERLLFLLSDTPGEDRVNALSAALAPLTPHVLIENSENEQAVVLFLTCQTPDAAAARTLADTLRAYFNTPYYVRVRPPWDPADDAADRARDSRIQATMLIIGDATRQTFEHPEVRALMGRMLAESMRNPAQPPDPQSPVRRELNVLTARIQAELIQQLAAGRGVELDPDTLRTFGSTNGLFQMDASLLEQFSEAVYQPPLPLSAAYGDVAVQGRQLDLTFVALAYVALGLPALFAYLQGAGCTGFDYRLEDFEDVRGD